MAAALLRSSLGQALRRAAAAPAPSSRFSSAAAGARRHARTYYGHAGRSSYDAQAYSPGSEFLPRTERDKFDGIFGFAAFVATVIFVGLMQGDYHFWNRPNFDAGSRPAPRMARPGR